jgi:hypothetical protein
LKALRYPALALALAFCLLPTGCGDRSGTPAPTTPVAGGALSNPNAPEAAKEQATQQEQIARQKQQEALQHTAVPPPQ